MERLLKVSDVIERTQMSRSAIYERILTGELPSVAIGRSRRVREADLDRFIQDRATPGPRELATA